MYGNSVTIIPMRFGVLGRIKYDCCNKATKSTSIHAIKYTVKYSPNHTQLYAPSVIDLHFYASFQDSLNCI